MEGSGFGVRAWRAWPLGDGSDSNAPDVSFVPMMLRRRLSRLSRLVLATGRFEGLADGVPTVLATRHGEIGRTTGILQQIASGELVSPAAFSLSVHNSAVGLDSLIRKDRTTGTVVSAGLSTLAMGLVEAISELQSGAPVVRFIYADECVPSQFGELVDGQQGEIAIAMILERSSEGDCFRIEPTSKPVPGTLAKQADDLQAVLAGNRKGVALGDESGSWLLQRGQLAH